MEQLKENDPFVYSLSEEEEILLLYALFQETLVVPLLRTKRQYRANQNVHLQYWQFFLASLNEKCTKQKMRRIDVFDCA